MTSTDDAEPAATLPAGRMPLLGFGTWQIYAVGAATQKAGDRPRLFADGFTVSLK